MATESLADQAVAALAAITQMDADVTNEHEERHHVRNLKRQAQTIVENALRQARELAWLAEDIKRESRIDRESGNG